MDFTKLNLFFDDCQTEITLENHNDDTVVFAVVEYEKDYEKSTPGSTVLKPSSTTEVYLGTEEATKLVDALKFIIPKE